MCKHEGISFFYADKGFAPLLTGHEPVMLLLHQSALRCSIHPNSSHNSPVQVSHLLLPITKRLHYFYANQALFIHAYIHTYIHTYIILLIHKNNNIFVF